MKTIAVYCGAKAGNNKNYMDACDKLASIFSTNNLAMVYGGGNVGLMGRMANQLLSLNMRVYGVIPERIEKMGVAHPSLTTIHIVPDMHTRKLKMAEMADAFITLPGGIGTMEEIFEVFSWSQLGYHTKPFALLNTDGYYDQLIAFLKSTVDKGFVEQQVLNRLIVETDENTLVNKLLQSII